MTGTVSGPSTGAPDAGGHADLLLAVERQRRIINELLLEKYEPIAIVGAGLNFPGGCHSLSDFADLLARGRSATGPTPADRWDVEGFHSAEPGARGKINATGGGYLDDIDMFDAKFFNISPKEADYVDPQQRLILEVAWQALESANIDPTALRGGNGGVYLGVSGVDFNLEVDALGYEELNGYIGTGLAHSAVAGRLSYFLGWRGPSVAIDTACSSSLVALHLAVQALRRREADIALSGGVNLIHHPRNHVIFTDAHMLAPDGRCKTFDDAADGYARSEGCAVLVLKRLSDAARDGDEILALVRGTAVGQDGESGGLTVPNGVAQEAVMRAALTAAMLEPASVQYVEAHGTGTSLGDPIEMGAINAVFGAAHGPSGPLFVGSAKTNIGHMEPAAGVGGVVKSLLQLRDATLYAHLNLTTPSRHIPWDAYPVTVPTRTLPWPGATRRAMVNSFGFQGTLASVVLEQPPAPSSARPGDEPTEPAIFTLSARTRSALRDQVARYRRHLTDNPDLRVADVSYSGNIGRAHFTHRIAGVVHDRSEVLGLLDRQADAMAEPAPAPSGPGGDRVAFLFTGQGSQYAGMGRELYHSFPVFRRHVDECDRLFGPLLGRSVRALMLGEMRDADRDIHQTVFTQPALFTLEYALAKLWMSWGVRPAVLIGHSIGEVAAVTVAGLLSLPDAAALVAARATLMQSVSAPGGMVAVGADAAGLADLVAKFDDLAVAAINAPDQCVLSGGRESLALASDELDRRGIRTKPLEVSHAFHSPLMAEVFDVFREAIRDVRFTEPELTCISNLTGQVAAFTEVGTPDYWVRHIGEPVNFAAGMRTVEQRGRHVFVEIGPGSALTGLGRRCVDARQHLWLPSLDPSDPDGSVIRGALARLYAAGAPVSWTGYHRDRPGQRVGLPTYAFERKRYWLPVAGRRHVMGARPSPGGGHPLLGSELSTAEQRHAGVREFGAALSANNPGYLADHVVMGRVVFPAAGYLEMLLAAQDAVFGQTGRELSDLRILEPLLLAEDHPVQVRTRLRLRDGGASVEIISRVDAEYGTIERTHVTAEIGGLPDPADALAAAAELQALVAGAPDDERPASELYGQLAGVGLAYGPSFRRLHRVARYGTDVACAELVDGDQTGPEQLPPPVLDGALQALVAASDLRKTYLPVRFGRIHLFKRPRGALRGIVRLARAADPDEPEMTADLLLTEKDQPVCLVRGLRLKRVTAPATAAAGRLFHRSQWTKRSLPPVNQSAGPRNVLVMHRAAADFAGLTDHPGEDRIRLCFADSVAEATATLAQDPAVTDVCWFWRSYPQSSGTRRLTLESEHNYRDLLALSRGLGAEHSYRLWLVTAGGQPLPGDRTEGRRPDALAAATLWGFGHVLLNEYPRHRATLVDLPPPAEDGTDLRYLLEEWLAADTDEFQVAYRASGRHVRRIQPWQPPGAEDGNFELTVTRYGQFSDVRPVPVPDTPPEGDEIQVRVHAAGLNFKDVLNALGMLRAHAESAGLEHRPLPLGFEGAGTVLAAGPDAEFGVGDEVLLSHLGCMRRRVTVPSSAAVSKPAAVGFAEGAGLVSAYVTAYYALHEVAGIQRGDRILIHAAAGGVGQAAVQLARLAGAEVFATASPRKWPLLRAQGIDHVMNSRSLDFADEVLERTGGRGVDIILNSLNKDYIDAGLRSLGHGGRFVELGKIGVLTPAEAKARRPDVRYANFDMSEFPEADLRRLNRNILQTVVRLIADGELQPPPTTVYRLDEVEEALGVLSRGANIGKLVLDFGADAPAARPVELDPDETYLITGGTGALGTLTAGKLVELGARRLALMSRHELAGRQVAELETRLGHGVRVSTHRGDVAEPADVERVMTALRAGPHPLGGIVHLAGVLADAPVSAQTWDSVETVLRPKMCGTWLLHEAAANLPRLKFFVCYSSVTSVLGTPGQANYAAANAFMDALMQWRAADGQPALSVNWGPWAEVGMAANLDDRLRGGIERQGIRPLTADDALRGLVDAWDQPVAQLMICEFDWRQVTAGRLVSNALFRAVSTGGGPDRDTLDLAQLRAQPRREREAAITGLIRARLADVLRYDNAADVEPDARFAELGLDSLTAVELKNSLEAGLRLPLAMSIVFDYPTIPSLTQFIDGQLVPEPAGDPVEAVDPAGVPRLSDAEADAELDALKDFP